VQSDGFKLTMDTESCQLIPHNQDAAIHDESDSFILTIQSGVNIDVFSAFQDEYILFIDHVKYEFEIIQVVYESCKNNEYPDMSTGFACVCSANYHKNQNSQKCVSCEILSFECCGDRYECGLNKKKCNAGFRLSVQGEGILCDQTGYCIGSEEFKCAENSVTLYSGAYQDAQCICTTGLFKHDSDFVQCPLHFFCTNNVILECPLHIQTTQAGAGYVSDCSCVPGYFVYSNNGLC